MIKMLFNKYRSMIYYIFFGGCTTLVNVLTYMLCTRIFNIETMISTIYAWCLAVLFAYITNRFFVFESKNETARSIFVEFLSFVGCRILSGIIDFSIMLIFVDFIGINDLFVKIIANVFVVFFNYIASRLIVFKQHFK